MKKTLLTSAPPLSVKVLLTILAIILWGQGYVAVAQTADKEPHIDADGNRIPWYLPLPDDGQTRSTVDLRFAPAEMKMIGPSPAAAGATRYADYSVSYGLGLADISIPLYEVKSHSLTLPISLSYDSGGIRVDDVSGPVGLGWTLEAGGVITRTVMGLDDNTATGWPDRPSEDPTNTGFQNYTYLSDVLNGEADSGADLYSYSFCGHHGSFYVNWNTTPYTVIPTTATDLDIFVTVGGFTITDTDGTMYVFTQQETSARFTSITLPFYGAGSSPELYPQNAGPITAWYLTEVIAMDGTDSIKLYYKDTYGSLVTTRHANTRTYQVTYRYLYSGSYQWRAADGTWDSFPAISYLEGAYVTETTWTPHYLDHITFAGGRVDFKYKQNTTSPTTVRRSYPWILDYLTVKSILPGSSTGTEVFRATFTLPFQNPDLRNLLTGVALTGRGGTAIETYTFTYINAGTAMDPNSKDMFGYYNGAANSNGTGFLRLFGNSNTFNEQVANRNYNSTYVSNLSLESIVTSSGSKTRFQYEGNSIPVNASGVLFNTLGVGHRIKSISTYDLSGGSETLVRRRDFTYSSPGITIPAYAFKHAAFMSLTEVFREDLLDGSPWWCLYSGYQPMPRTLTVAFSDQSVLPGVPLESARIYYGSVTERVSGSTTGSPSFRTDYVFDTYGAEHSQTGMNWILGTDHDTHDNDNNMPGGHLYHFFQRPPQYIPLNLYETSLDLSQAWYHFIPEDFPQLTSPTVVRKYKWQGNTDTIVSQTTNEYSENRDTLRVGISVRNMLTLGDELYIPFEQHVFDYYRVGINQRIKWRRLTSTTETETLDDDSTQSAVTTYTYIPASSPSTSIPAVGSVLSPKTMTTVYGSSSNTRTYSWSYTYPTEISVNVPWALQIVSRGYRLPIAETVTANNGSSSATTTRSVTWAAFTPPDTTGMTIYRPSTVSIARKEPGSSTTSNVGPNVTYGAYDRHGNVLQVTQDSELPVVYIWGYGGLRPVMEVTGGAYGQVRGAVDSQISAIESGTVTVQQMSAARASLESLGSTYVLASWYLYDLPFGVSKASDVSGRLTQYEYDGAGRLTTVKDESGNRISSYAYALNNGGSGSPNSISSVTHTTAGSSATAGVRDVAYFDGLGRTVQLVAAKASTAASGSSVLRDLVTPVVPDFLDREDAKAYIPYPASTTSSNSGSYRSGAVSAQQSYHGSGVRAYTENTYELSDRNRVIASSLPGFTETTTTQTNKSPANTVLKLSYNASTKKISASSYYDEGRFVLTVTEGPDGSRTEVYTDELGTPVLERVKLDASGTMADTYYIRDVLGRVLCVVPPAEAAQLSSSTSNFSTANCYTYAYDGRDRVVKRQTPGGVEETITYNDVDLPVTRIRKPADGASVNEVFTIVYDIFKRPTSETYKYGSNAAVTLAEYEYDSYPSWAPAFAAESGYVTTSDKDLRTRGLKTAERVALLPAGVAPSAMTSSNTSTKEYRAFYYDARGRVRQVARTNVQGGTDRISSSYDFAGNLLKERQKIQPGSGLTTHTLDRTYTYDGRLRLSSVAALLDNGPAGSQTISYDALQRTYQINRGTNTEVTMLTYTLQGWLSSASSASWEETLRYASPQNGTDSLPGKVGLITEWVQQQKGTLSGGSSTADTFAFSYDKAGRLTGSLRYIDDSSSSVNTLTERNITYDRSGNLLTLDRYGASSGTTPTESLSYTYSGPKRNSWTYDAHANVTADPDGALSIAWNAIDLPRTLTTGSGTGASSTQRAYLADGSLAQVGDGTTTRLYLGDIVFNKASNGTVTLESAGWEGGRLLPGSGSDKVLYTVADHLGSVRVVKDGMGNIRQRFDYYPYGTVSYVWTNSSATDSSEKRYRFGGKEIAGSSLTDLAGTGAAPGAPYLDFGARLYSPRTATWMSPDPVKEKYYSISPYAFCSNNPVNRIDPFGTHDYNLKANGEWEKKDTDDPFDVIIALSGEQLIVLDRSIMGNMVKGQFFYYESQDQRRPSKKPLHYSVFKGNNPEALTVFKFLSDNTSVEWLLYNGVNGESLLGTNHMASVVFENTIERLVNTSSNVMRGDPIWKIHNHPGETSDEIDSMSVDVANTKGHPSFHSFVYINQSGIIYDINNGEIKRRIKWDNLLKLYHRR